MFTTDGHRDSSSFKYMQLVKDNNNSHWYELLPSGDVVPQYEATLREARKLGYYISPTTVEKDTMANPTLARWLKNEIAKAFVTNARMAGETDESYAARCLEASDEISKRAREKGTSIHEAIENHPTPPSDLELEPYFRHFDNWFSGQFSGTVSAETMLADSIIGVAGRVDRIAIHNIYGPTIIDFKTQNVRKGKPVFYSSFPRQLAFYAQAYARKHHLDVPPRIMSVIIDSNGPAPVHPKVYTPEEQQGAYDEFLCLLWLWCRERDYWPGTLGRWNPRLPPF